MPQQYAFTIGGESIQFRAEDGWFRADKGGVETWHQPDALTIWTADELAAHDIVRTEVPASPMTVEEFGVLVNAMRDARISGGMTYLNKRFQTRATDRENIVGMADLARDAIAAGALPDDYRWLDPDEDFEWILEDNTTLKMDAHQVVGLKMRGIAFKSATTRHAFGLKRDAETLGDLRSYDLKTGWPE